MDADVPTYRRNFRTTLALEADNVPLDRGDAPSTASVAKAAAQNATLRAADEVDCSVDDPLLVPESPPPFVVPVDRYYFVKNVFLLLGVVLMLPWNFTANATDYWMYKFRNVSIPYDPSLAHKTSLQANAFSVFSVASTFPSLAAVYLGTLFNHKLKHETRNILGFCLCIAFFVMVTAFVKVDTDNWQIGFFVLTVYLLAFLNAFASWLQGGLIGLATVMPSVYMHNLVIGMAMGGVFASVMEIVCLLGHTDPSTSALAYFLCAIVVFVVALVCFIAMLSTDFFIHCMKNPEANIQGMLSYDELGVSVSALVILRKVWQQAASALYTLLISMAIFPAVGVLVVSTSVGSGSVWTGRLFIPVCGYLLYNAGDLCGRIACSYAPLDVKHERLVLVLSLARTVFVPLLMLCNAQPRRHLPVVFHSDVAFVVFMTAFSFTNGYLLSASLMQVSRKVESYLQERAGFLMTSAMMTGLSIGGFLSAALVAIL